MHPSIALYRRLEGDLVRSGRIILRSNDQHFDLTESLWRGEDPMLISALVRRNFFDPDRFEAWMEENLPPEARPIEDHDVLLPPLLQTEIGKIIALGKNFCAHAEEFNEEVPEDILYFNKLPETLRGHNQAVSPPKGYKERLDHEVELAVIIGRKAQRVKAESALSHVAGYTVANDLTLRTWQGADRDKRHPWFRSKNFDGSCPLGPGFVPEIAVNPRTLGIRATVNGELRQEANTSEMAVSVTDAIERLSQHMTLNPGDIILMGTPAGVGPLKNGDTVVCEIDGIGRLATPIKR